MHSSRLRSQSQDVGMDQTNKWRDDSRSDVQSLGQLLQCRASAETSGATYTFVRDLGCNASLTAAELHQRATIVAARLRLITSTGDRALLLYPVGGDYLISFFACI